MITNNNSLEKLSLSEDNYINEWTKTYLSNVYHGLDIGGIANVKVDMLIDLVAHLNEKIKELAAKPNINLEGLLKDGYTFICPIHGLHPNCDCQDNQIKVFLENEIKWYYPEKGEFPEIDKDIIFKQNTTNRLGYYNGTDFIDQKGLKRYNIIAWTYLPKFE